MKHYKYLWVLFALLFFACSNDSKNEADVKKVEKQDSTLIKIGIKMEKTGGVFTLPCNVNGVKMNFILDTGASNVCISLTEALFLYKNGYLEDADIIGKSLSQVADGSIVENMEIILHSIEIEGIMITDVKALVTKSLDAPLLLGQSAIQKLGKIEIKGDSLFIIKKGITTSTTSSTTIKEEKDSIAASTDNVSDPDWWDDVKAFFGSDCKIEKYLNKSWSAYKKGLLELAEKNAEQASDCDDDNWKPYALLGYIRYEKGDDFYQVKNTYEKYRRLNEDRETLYLMNGQDSITYKESMFKLAFAYVRSYEKDNNSTWELKKAIQVAQELIDKDPSYYLIYYPMIIAYCLQGQYETATNWAKKMLESKDSKIKYRGYFSLAYIAQKQGRINDAIRFYEKTIELNPESADAYNNLSNCYPEDNPYAIKLKMKAAKLGSKNSANWLKEHSYSW